MSSQKRLHILVVEDDPGDMQLLLEAFEEANLQHHLSVASDGEAALQLLRGSARRPNLILLDLNLPKKNGHEVLRELKADGVLKRIPVLIFSTSRRAEDIQESYDLQASGYITKPFQFDELVRVVQQISEFWSETVQLPEP